MSRKAKIFLIFITISFLIANFVLAQGVGEREDNKFSIFNFQFSNIIEKTSPYRILDKSSPSFKKTLLNIWEKLSGVAGNFFAAASTIIEQKKPFLKEEWQKEKQEMLGDLIKIKNLANRLWQKIGQKIK